MQAWSRPALRAAHALAGLPCASSLGPLRRYGSYLVVDSEDEWYRQEVAKLAADVEKLGLGALRA